MNKKNNYTWISIENSYWEEPRQCQKWTGDYIL